MTAAMPPPANEPPGKPGREPPLPGGLLPGLLIAAIVLLIAIAVFSLR
jgi:hypothetical protein